MPSSKDKYKTFPRIVPLTRHDFVGKELIRRKKKSFGKNAVPRAVWVRAISNAVQVIDNSFVGPQKTSLVGNLNVMVGGLLSKSFYTRGSFETLYRRPGRQMKDKPIPGIDSINMSSKGELQSLRKVTINWTCPNLEDLDELAPYWLTPGVSIWLEWGWGQVGKRPVTTPVDNINKLKEYYLDAGKIYDDIIIKANGNQDAYIGLITNFSFNANDDGSWTCTTELTSMGQTLLSLDLNKDKVQPSASTKEGKNIKRSQTIKGFIEDKFSEGDLLDLPKPDGTGTWKLSKDVLNLSQKDGGFLWLDKDITFVSWKFIEQQIVNAHSAWEFNGGAGKGTAFKIDSSQVEISNDKFLFSTDAKIGLVVHSASPGALIFNTNNISNKSGKITRLYFNSDFVKETFSNAETLEEALMKLLRGISNACGDIWNFKIQPDPLKESVLQVIDLNFISQDDITDVDKAFNAKLSSADRILSFGGYSGESILASVSFTSKLTDQLALKYFVGRNKSNTNCSGIVVNDDNDAGVKAIFGGHEDRILRRLCPPPTPPLSDAELKKQAEKENEEKDKRENFSVSFLELRKALANGEAPKNSESGWPPNIIILDPKGKSLLIEYLNRNLEANGKTIIENRVRHNPIYPLEISVTIDGISGVLPGNCFTLDNVPKLYKNSGIFQIVEVSHDVSGDDWTTTFRSFFRYMGKDTESVVYYDPNNREKEGVVIS